MSPCQNGEIQTGRCGLLDWELQHRPSQNVVLLKTSGPIDKLSLGEMIAATIGFSVERHSYQIFADHRASSLNLDPLEIYYLPKTLLMSGLESKYFAALVFTHLTEDLQFLENVCRNSGFQLAVFTTLEAGSEWLSKQGESVALALEAVTPTKVQT